MALFQYAGAFIRHTGSCSLVKFQVIHKHNVANALSKVLMCSARTTFLRSHPLDWGRVNDANSHQHQLGLLWLDALLRFRIMFPIQWQWICARLAHCIHSLHRYPNLHRCRKSTILTISFCFCSPTPLRLQAAVSEFYGQHSLSS